MKKIDDDLGGTTPLNIILQFSYSIKEAKKDEDNDEFDEWDEDNLETVKKISLNIGLRDKMDKIIKVHDYLDSFT